MIPVPEKARLYDGPDDAVDAAAGTTGEDRAVCLVGEKQMLFDDVDRLEPHVLVEPARHGC
ncbi:hypothetical protein D3C86_1913300 [compost metagenome]